MKPLVPSRRSWVSCWGAAVLVGCLGAFFASRTSEHLQSRLTDPWYRVGRRAVHLDPNIELILLDDRTLEQIHAPTVFWSGLFAQLMADLLRARVRAVGVDWLPYEMDVKALAAVQHLYPELGSPGKTDPWQSLAQAIQDDADSGRALAPVVQGIYPPNLDEGYHDPLQANVNPADRNAQYRPPWITLHILQPEQTGFLNSSRDADGILRAQAVVPLRVDRSLWNGVSAYSPFAARLAELATGEQLQPGQKTWQGAALPLEGVQLPVCYPPKAGGFPTRSFVDVLRATDQQRQSWYAGKTVLVGPGSPIFQDFVNTPLGFVLGVETHGYVVNSLLTQQYLQPLSLWSLLPLTALVLALAAVVGVALEGPVGLVLFVLMLAGTWGGLRELFVQSGRLTPVLALLVGEGVAFLTAALLRARLKSQVERHIRQLFGRYVSPSVMETLLRDPEQAALGAVSRRRITVLFTDINGFSTHSEQKPPEQIMAMLNRYFEAMNRIIFEQGGTIKQFVGDEIMAMYGAPLPHPCPEVAAVRTAVEMKRELRRQHALDPDEEKGFYLIKAGIHCGDVILGNVGSAERTEYAAVGDDVNLGSRIMGLAKPLGADILISGDVFEKVKHLDDVLFEDKGRLPVKGRKERVVIYAVLLPEEVS